jgi:hypothetical protein
MSNDEPPLGQQPLPPPSPASRGGILRFLQVLPLVFLGAVFGSFLAAALVTVCYRLVGTGGAGFGVIKEWLRDVILFGAIGGAGGGLLAYWLATATEEGRP